MVTDITDSNFQGFIESWNDSFPTKRLDDVTAKLVKRHIEYSFTQGYELISNRIIKDMQSFKDRGLHTVGTAHIKNLMLL